MKQLNIKLDDARYVGYQNSAHDARLSLAAWVRTVLDSSSGSVEIDDGGKTATVTLRVDSDEKSRWEAAASAAGRSLSSWVRWVLNRAVDVQVLKPAKTAETAKSPDEYQRGASADFLSKHYLGGK